MLKHEILQRMLQEVEMSKQNKTNIHVLINNLIVYPFTEGHTDQFNDTHILNLAPSILYMYASPIYCTYNFVISFMDLKFKRKVKKK